MAVHEKVGGEGGKGTDNEIEANGTWRQAFGDSSSSLD